MFTSDDAGSRFTIACVIARGKTTKLTVTEFNIAVIVVAKIVAYKFLCGVLLGMRDRSADGAVSK